MKIELIGEDMRDSFADTLRKLKTQASNLDGLSAGPPNIASSRLRQGFLEWHEEVETFFFNHLTEPPELPMSMRYRALLEGTVPDDQMYRVMNGERRRILVLLSTVEQAVAVPIADGQARIEPHIASSERVEETESPLVFISHSSEDKSRFVVPFATRLRANGVNAWLDRWEMLPGDSLVERIFAEGIGRARAVIAVVSRDSAKSKWVTEELNAATVRKIGGSTRLIVVRLDKATVPAALSGSLWEDIDPSGDWDEGFERILRAIFEVPDRPALGPLPAFVRQSYGMGEGSVSDSEVSLTSAADSADVQTTASSAVSLVKLGISDDRYRIRMEEAIKALTEKSLARLSKANYPWQVANLSNDGAYREVQLRLESFDVDTADLATAVATGIYYGDAKHNGTWTRPILRLARSVEEDRPQQWQDIWSAVARYPVLRLFYAAGVAAVAATRESLLSDLMHLGPLSSLTRRDPQEIWEFVDSRHVLPSDLAKLFPRWEGTRYYHAASIVLRTSTRPIFGELLDDAEFAQCFERFEYLRSLVELHHGSSSGLGEFAWYAANERTTIHRAVRNEIMAKREAWPLVQAGEFDGSSDKALEALEKLSNSISGRNYF